jgi:hypothetical protein
MLIIFVEYLSLNAICHNFVDPVLKFLMRYYNIHNWVIFVNLMTDEINTLQKYKQLKCYDEKAAKNLRLFLVHTSEVIVSNNIVTDACNIMYVQ